jgi:uncharacterized protein (DUF1778 family)
MVLAEQSTILLHVGVCMEANMGRKPKRPIRGKHVTFTARVTPETRQMLEEEADYNQRTLSSEIELLVRQAVETNRLRRNEIDAIFQLAWDEARAIVNQHGAPSTSETAHRKVMAVLEAAKSKLPAPPSPEKQEQPNRTFGGGGKRALEIDSE